MRGVEVFEQRGQSWGYVLDEAGHVLGFARAADLPDRGTVRQAIRGEATTVEADETLSDALVKMLSVGSGTACVVDGKGCFLGAISLRTIEEAVQENQ
ncbi:MAG TPA: CBS domain-containing protein [Firmicutes bacterium]|nr:CBS domain-containing protein [Bacillota bacterium]